MVRYRIYNIDDSRYIDAIGKYVYVSVHFRGTSVNIQPQGGFLLGIEEYDTIDDNYQFNYDDFPAFRNDMTAIRDESIQKCIHQLTDTKNSITYQQLVELVNDTDSNNYSSLIYVSDRANIEADFYKFFNQIKRADRIFVDKQNNLIYILVNYEKIVEELNEINVFCKENNISFHWI
jgi:hypothetical protein